MHFISRENPLLQHVLPGVDVPQHDMRNHAWSTGMFDNLSNFLMNQLHFSPPPSTDAVVVVFLLLYTQELVSRRKPCSICLEVFK